MDRVVTTGGVKGIAGAIVFDLDGTLVDSAPDIAAALNRMLAGHGLAPLGVREVEAMTGEGAGVLVERALRRAGVAADAARVGRDTEIYLAHYAARPCERSVLFADAAAVLPALRRAGARLAVCTNKPAGLATTVLGALDLGELMGAVVGADSTVARKPDPRPLHETLRRLGVAVGDAIFVGDTAIDRDCAAAAGVACRIVDWRADRDFPLGAATGLARFADLLPREGAA